ncbi:MULTISPECIES: Fis family transcriptional regulator [unclassified Rhodococcus (in: high G+C Gram-positive bacteria)]|uniref:Fis family transcriptional regulator n=1 Tax=unclassified Rhodococcus (in: high G+C Gram-positive bacteria) TaxID=192944 RepID=UPI0027E17491|nr:MULTISPECIES: Fis family transcriptional regulator [unclassified Rhodococcus (in: high G+C Gram-positive bacteria)]
MTLLDGEIAREAQRWTNGERGPVVDESDVLAAADLSAFVTKAMAVGAHALSATGQAQEARVLERMIDELGEKAAQTTTDAAKVTSEAAKSASEAVTKAAADAQKALLDADAATRKSFTDSVRSAHQEMTSQLSSLFGGNEPEVINRFAPLLEKFASDLERRATASTTELLTKAAKQFDPTDSTSPMAKHAAELAAQQTKLAERTDKHHAELAAKLDAVTTALTVREARADVARLTPLKGNSYADDVHAILIDIATGLGDEYTDTGSVAGAISRSKKGDGVLTMNDNAKVVVEMTDSKRTAWNDYLDEAERNRRAGSSLGLVRTLDQNNGESIRLLGKRRIVMAFDPASDDPSFLRTVVQLLRAVAAASSSTASTEGIAIADTKITEAIEQLGKIDEIKKIAGTIQKNAQKVENTCTVASAGIERLLTEAMSALASVEVEGPTADAAINAA